jgi:hypothetical protein
MESTRSSETSVCNKPTRRCIPEDGLLQVIFLLRKFSLTCGPCSGRKGRSSDALLNCSIAGVNTEGSARSEDVKPNINMRLGLCDPNAVLVFPSAVYCSRFRAKWGTNSWRTLSPYLAIFMVHLSLRLVLSSLKFSRVAELISRAGESAILMQLVVVQLISALF